MREKRFLIKKRSLYVITENIFIDSKCFKQIKIIEQHNQYADS